MDWNEFAYRFGFPAACVLGMAWFAWQVFRWLSTKVFEPILTAHAAHLADNTAEMRKQTTKLDEIAAALPTLCQANCCADNCDNYKRPGDKR
jgi:hypothetical protein